MFNIDKRLNNELCISNNLGLLSLIDMPPTREAFLRWKAKVPSPSIETSMAEGN